MEREDIKIGDLVHVEYQWNKSTRTGVGFVYQCGQELIIGVSCQEGGTIQLPVSETSAHRPITGWEYE